MSYRAYSIAFAWFSVENAWAAWYVTPHLATVFFAALGGMCFGLMLVATVGWGRSSRWN